MTNHDYQIGDRVYIKRTADLDPANAYQFELGEIGTVVETAYNFIKFKSDNHDKKVVPQGYTQDGWWMNPWKYVDPIPPHKLPDMDEDES